MILELEKEMCEFFPFIFMLQQFFDLSNLHTVSFLKIGRDQDAVKKY